MPFVALVTLLLIGQYIFFMMMVGQARSAAGIKAPAMAGDEVFERHVRVHLNTLEQLMITLPAMWVCASYFSTTFAATMGTVFFVGRFIYRSAYLADPSSRGKGVMIGFLASVAMVLAGFWGVIRALL